MVVKSLFLVKLSPSIANIMKWQNKTFIYVIFKRIEIWKLIYPGILFFEIIGDQYSF